MLRKPGTARLMEKIALRHLPYWISARPIGSDLEITACQPQLGLKIYWTPITQAIRIGTISPEWEGICSYMSLIGGKGSSYQKY